MNTRNYSTLTKKYKLLLSAVHMVYRLVNSTTTVDELSLRLTRLLCQFIRAQSASIMILNPSTKELEMVAIFDNRINILLTKKKDLKKIPPRERKVLSGISFFEERLIGIPLVADDNLGAIFIRRQESEESFTEFDRDMLSVFAEQSVTAIKNLQSQQQYVEVMNDSVNFIAGMLKRFGSSQLTHGPVYFKVLKMIAQRMHLSEINIKTLSYSCILHDAGLSEIPIDMLNKNATLSAIEEKIMQAHPQHAINMFHSIQFLNPVMPIILHHHERYDGKGYPSGLCKEEIPLGSRLMLVVDAIEAMMQGRPYKKPKSITEMMEELQRHSGTQFDPTIVKAVNELIRQKKFRNYLSLMKL